MPYIEHGQQAFPEVMVARPRHEHPTPAELEILQILWEKGPATVRQTWDVMGGKKRRAYTSVMSLMNVMAEKGLLSRQPRGKAFLYAAKVKREQALGGMVTDLLNRAFSGSASALVAQLLGKTTPRELEEIRQVLDAHRRESGGQ
jgi:predicted transcriptional regulator